MKAYGVDLHSDSMTCAFWNLEKKNRKKKQFSCGLYGKSFDRFLNSLDKEDIILVEATTQSFWFYDQVKDKVRACYILNTNKYRNEGNKTDKIDSDLLLNTVTYHEIMNTDPTKRPYIYVPLPAVRELRGMFTTYNLQKKLLNQTKNRIHSIYKQNGMKLQEKDLGTKKGRYHLLETYPLSTTWNLQIATLLNTIEVLVNEKNQTNDLIICKGYELFPREIELLISIKGFSPLTATALMADAADLGRFKNSKKFCSYLRCAPKINSSNKKEKIGHVNKQSRSLTCTLLTQSLVHVAGMGEHFVKFKNRIKKGKKPGVVRIALIRKLLTSAYNMLEKGELFYWTDKKSYERKLLELKRIVRKYERRNSKKIA